jgi:hypothetical protein
VIVIYVHPAHNRTGAPHLQPVPKHTLPGWFVCADVYGQLHHQDTGCLDAPSSVPTGSVRAMPQGSAITLGIAHGPRVPTA